MEEELKPCEYGVKDRKGLIWCFKPKRVKCPMIGKEVI